MAIVLHTGLHRDAARERRTVREAADPADYREFVFRCALAICGEPESAEDVSQEVLLIVLKSAGKIAKLDSPLAWIRRVTVRCATRHLKRHRPVVAVREAVENPDSASEALAVYETLRRLSPEDRALLGMALHQGLSYREIGDALGIPEGTVASRLNAAKKAFQKEWER